MGLWSSGGKVEARSISLGVLSRKNMTKTRDPCGVTWGGSRGRRDGLLQLEKQGKDLREAIPEVRKETGMFLVSTLLASHINRGLGWGCWTQPQVHSW